MAGASLLDVLRNSCMSCTLAASYVIGVDFMAWIESPQSMAFALKLNDGETATGGVKTVNVNMGKLNKDAWDLQKAGAIVSAFNSAQVFTKAIYDITHTVVNGMEAE